MSDPLRYVGFDLGTTNSAAAFFDGETVQVVRTSQGGQLTPSVVRITKKGATSVGHKARRFLDKDADNTHTGFKRLMGTGKTLAFPAAGLERRPEELSAEVLKSLIADVDGQFGFAPTRAVITVPALFELPQSRATTEAATLAGLEAIELVQEPVASALAAGWTEDSAGAWLVYDLGGGTFDVTLLASQDGVLRVEGHDGDNFLGGRDFDTAIVDWLLTTLRDDGCDVRRDNPAHGAALRTLAAAAEEAKIELSRSEQTTITLVEPLVVDGEEHEVDVPLDRATFERLVLPLLDRSIDVCLRLLDAHDRRAADIDRVVLVGGPTMIPALRARVQERLAPLAEHPHDPMTLVAQGAALFAAQAGLDAQGATASLPVRHERGHKVLLKYPSMSTDLSPFVIGRVVGQADDGARLSKVIASRHDDKFVSEPATVEEDGSFAISLELLPRRANRFSLMGQAEGGDPVTVEPGAFTIVHGLTIGDPPLSRSVGVALANDRVRVYFERGTPLPAKRTFVHHTVDAVAPGEDDHALVIPLVQGEFDDAHLCRLVGSLDVPARVLKEVLPAGTQVEVTLELDRGGHLTAQAYVPRIKEVFEGVAQLLVPACTPDVLEAELRTMHERIEALRADAFRMRMPELIAEIDKLMPDLDDAERGLDAARGGDEETAQRARRNLIELEARVVQLELTRDWPEIDSEAVDDIAFAASWVSSLGTETEQKLLDQAIAQANRAREAMDAGQLARRMRRVRNLGEAAYYRHPESWRHQFEFAAARADEATDPAKAAALVQKGRAIIDSGDHMALRPLTEQLWGLLPIDAKKRQRSHLSGVR